MVSTEHTFGSWLRQRRDELGVTQDEFSEYLGFSPAMLRKLESGERRPSGQIAYLLADYFRIPVDERNAFVAFARANHATLSSAETGTASGNGISLTPWRGLYTRRTNLPSMLTLLIGREREEVAVRDHLLHPKTRLLTLTGTPGIGKTRLGLQVASSLVEHFGDGVFFVDLAPIVDPDLVMPTVARAIGLTEASDRPTEGALLDYARERRMMLLLDNFEQVLDAAIAVVRLLEASPWLKVLVTSREALHVRGERRFLVPPLAVPDASLFAGQSPRQLPLKVLASYPSVELFLERARAVAPDFEFSEENAADVAAVCVGLEGLPLAIELAAARAKHFSPMEMRSAMNSHLKLLTGGARDLPARHRTLRGAIEWSYDLLDASEQRLFRHLGVFLGGFTAEALDAICEHQPDSPTSTLEMLLSLTDKHLVREERQVGKPGTGLRVVRFGLLEAVREYAVERMEKQGEAEEIRRRHADYYLSLAESAEQHFTGAQNPGWGAKQVEWVDRLEAELDNMRAALDWFQTRAEAEMEAGASALDNLQKALLLTVGLRRVWLARGHFVEGLQWLRELLAMVPKPLPAEPPQLRPTYATALLVVGRLVLLQGDAVSVRPLLEESLSIAIELSDKQRMAITLLVLGAVAQAQEDYMAARSYGKECLRLYRALGNKWGTAAVLEDLGNMELNEGDLVTARSLLEESLALYRAVGEDFGATSALESLGRITYYQGEYAAARAVWQESLQLRKKLGYKSKVGHSYALLGWAALREGAYDEARTSLKEGLLLARELGAVFTIYWCLVGFGALEGARGRAERVALLFGAAEALREARSVQLSPTNQAELDAEIAATRTQLHEETWDKVWAEGYAMTLEEAVVAALGY